MARKLSVHINEDRSIYNLETLINEIKNFDDVKELEDMLNSLNRHFEKNPHFIKESDYKLLNEALNNKISELKQEEITNKETMDKLKNNNPNLNNISVFSTDGEYNESKKDIEYIKYIDASGNVKILECPNGSALNDFLIKNPELAQTITASQLFDYFKKWINNEVDMKSVKEESAVREITDEQIQSDVYAVKEYADEHNLDKHITYGKDSNGELLYTANEVVLKFRDTAEGRKLFVVSGPDKELEKENETEKEESKFETTAEETDIQVNDNSDEIDTDELIDVDYSDFSSMITAIIKGISLSETEKYRLIAYANTAIINMKDGEIDPDIQNAIDTYVDLLRQKVDIGDSLSIEEEQVISSYDHTVETNKEKEHSKEKEQQPKVLTLKKIEDHSGNILTVSVLEVTTIIGILIAILIIALS